MRAKTCVIVYYLFYRLSIQKIYPVHLFTFFFLLIYPETQSSRLFKDYEKIDPLLSYKFKESINIFLITYLST